MATIKSHSKQSPYPLICGSHAAISPFKGFPVILRLRGVAKAAIAFILSKGNYGY